MNVTSHCTFSFKLNVHAADPPRSQTSKPAVLSVGKILATSY